VEKKMEDRWLSVDEIAEYLGVRRDTIYRWINDKDMPAHKLGRLWKFKKGQVDAWVEAGGAAATGTTGNQAETMPVKKNLKQPGGDNE
jgi:excisionase family DNA binding protein